MQANKSNKSNDFYAQNTTHENTYKCTSFTPNHNDTDNYFTC